MPVVAMLIFFLLGCSLCLGGVWWFVARRRLVAWMIAVQGTVVGIQTRHTRRSRSYNYFPIVRYRTISGQERTFTSETGAAGNASRYYLDQTLEVLYDPEDKAKPLLNSWWGVWSAPLFMVIGGLLFFAVALNMWLALGERIL